MTKEEFNSLIQEIGQIEDDVDRRDKLSILSDTYSPMFDTVDNLTQKNTQLTDDNEKLREANMKLFLRVGSKTEPDKIEEDKPKEKLKFEDLFNEKGEIK